MDAIEWTAPVLHITCSLRRIQVKSFVIINSSLLNINNSAVFDIIESAIVVAVDLSIYIVWLCDYFYHNEIFVSAAVDDRR